MGSEAYKLWASTAFHCGRQQVLCLNPNVLRLGYLSVTKGIEGVVQFDASSYLEGEYDVCVLTACDGILDHGVATRQNYADLFGSKKNGEARNFSQRCVSYALNCGSYDNITATAAEFSSFPEQGVLLGVFDGHGGKETSKICKETVAARCLEI